MKNPFKVGDKVYPAGCGEQVTLTGITPTSCIWWDEEEDCSQEFGYLQCSFKPWPCHERPIEDGWWIVSHNPHSGADPHVLLVKSGRVHFMRSTFHLSNYTFHKYLGKDWK